MGDDHKQVKAQKLVLATSSDYFREIFKNNEQVNIVICLQGMDSVTIDHLLEYIYYGEVQLYQENLDNFLEMARRLKLEGLTNNKQAEDMDDIEFKYFGEDVAGHDIIDDSNECEARTAQINSAGQKIRGKDLDWKSKITFPSAHLHHDSSLYKELKTSFTLKRAQDTEYGVVHKYICKYAQKTRYLKCNYQIKVVFPSKDLDAIVEDCNSHEHILRDDYVESNQVYRWGSSATEIIVLGIKSGASPKVIFRNMRDKGCFQSVPEPTSQQLYNKIANLKKVLN